MSVLKTCRELSGGGFSESGINKAFAEEFQKKYSCNLAANATAAAKLDVGLAELYSDEADPELDAELLTECYHKVDDEKFMELQQYRRTLPAFDFAMELTDVLNSNQVVVICGETGSGKTTQVCQYVLDDAILHGRGSTCRILCTQPRRISAISVAERVAEERGENIGLSVGYSIRLESRLPSRKAGTITFVTTGVVFQYLKEDPDLTRVSMIIVDEVHERDILTDFMLAILKDLISRRSDLKVVLMSATLNAERFSRYFNTCKIFNIPGQLHAVQRFYLEDVLTLTGFTFERKKPLFTPTNKPKKVIEFENIVYPWLNELEKLDKYPASTLHQLKMPESEDLNLELIQVLIEYICDEDVDDNGAILVFLPGWDEISRLTKELEKNARFGSSDFIIIPLHSSVPSASQRKIFNKPPQGQRKIIISTNIAETSITINDVVHVIDTGRIKMNNFDVKINLETLDDEWTSKASSTQRKGRAGRVREGFCYHLFTHARLNALEDSKKPEILRKRLEEVILQIKMLKLGGALEFLTKLMDAPSIKAVELGIQRLINLKALDNQESLTALGFHLAQLPMDPQTGKMILLGAIFSCIDPILSIAASLTHRDIFHRPMGQESDVDKVREKFSNGTNSDHMATVYAILGYEKARKIYNDGRYCYQNFLSQSNLRQIMSLKRQFASYLFRMKYLSSADYKDLDCNRNSENVGVVLAVAAAGLYPNIAEVNMIGKKQPRPVLRTFEDGVVSVHKRSVNSRQLDIAFYPYFVYFMKMKARTIYLFDTSMTMPLPLILFGESLNWVKTRGHSPKTVIGTHTGKFRFGCRDAESFKILCALKMKLNEFWDHKINSPGPTDWTSNSKEGLLLNTITGLFSEEYEQARKIISQAELIRLKALENSENDDWSD
ncbi:unnamed protein product [Allacma fusca]|uniref:RNA helicase n=1 Tax=Allacma fusca TaxID=39272 RepID=A0A8J2PJL5_9HEXA|nr:unnamed protein product [Allacma fusca]